MEKEKQYGKGKAIWKKKSKAIWKREGLSVAADHLQEILKNPFHFQQILLKTIEYPKSPNLGMLQDKKIRKNIQAEKQSNMEEGGSQCRCGPFAVDGKKEGFAARGQEATLGAKHNIYCMYFIYFVYIGHIYVYYIYTLCILNIYCICCTIYIVYIAVHLLEGKKALWVPSWMPDHSHLHVSLLSYLTL